MQSGEWEIVEQYFFGETWSILREGLNEWLPPIGPSWEHGMVNGRREWRVAPFKTKSVFLIIITSIPPGFCHSFPIIFLDASYIPALLSSSHISPLALSS